ncbi:M16 family metallopeptidase [Enterococcus sp. JM4C]|uniref:EF-P 5-aminopentanol modification-associated protein YfmF n=1 Tax=Candidatus Enterococcus huntleyi TaxID=1857217 RepID=UPI00137B1FA5|nr:pitrilysin family protein [Enterococcus sp. JM4C]KAF1295198.1 M16 family metallopeptidase [Enterococcus sp. JM4C]
MMTELVNGVNFHLLPTKKYKTLRIFLRFTARLDQATSTKRTLLSSLLETNSLNYPDQTKLSARLAELYGASFGLNVGKKGNLHWLNVGLNVVNGKYVSDEQLLSEVVDFLKEVLFYPNIKEGAFEAQTFALEKENMRAYLESLKEDKQTYASYSLQELYFDKDAHQRIPSFGTVEALEQLTAEALAAYYHEMMATDQVDIFMVGDVDEAAATALISQLPFAPRATSKPEIFYQQPVSNVIAERQEQEAITQAKLNLAYSTDVYYGETQRFALMVFNGLFGGFPHSKLFMNVREKESLAYYASSSVDTFRGYMTVQTGIDGVNRNKVMHLIAEQLESLRQGEVSDLELAQTKAMLRNQYLLSLDNPQSAIETNYINQWLPETELTDEAWLALLEGVTVAEVQAVARQIKLQAVFFLDGESDHE